MLREEAEEARKPKVIYTPPPPTPPPIEVHINHDPSSPGYHCPDSDPNNPYPAHMLAGPPKPPKMSDMMGGMGMPGMPPMDPYTGMAMHPGYEGPPPTPENCANCRPDGCHAEIDAESESVDE